MKIKNNPNKKKLHVVIIGGIMLSSIIIIAFYLYYELPTPIEGEWISSGPFSINKSQYKLGENVFIIVRGLQSTDVGEIDVVDPKGDTFTKIPFNGTMKSDFKQFFKPNTERYLGLCNATSLVGNWNMVFKGVSYKSIPFEIVGDWIPGSQAELTPVPKGLDPC